MSWLKKGDIWQFCWTFGWETQLLVWEYWKGERKSNVTNYQTQEWCRQIIHTESTRRGNMTAEEKSNSSIVVHERNRVLRSIRDKMENRVLHVSNSENTQLKIERWPPCYLEVKPVPIYLFTLGLTLHINSHSSACFNQHISNIKDIFSLYLQPISTVKNRLFSFAKSALP